MNAPHAARLENVHQLKTFRALAQFLSFTRAAESLLLTQSAVSHQIAALEQTLGAELFWREGRSVRLTPAGQILLQHTARVFEALAEADTAVRQSTNPNVGRLRIGASSTACHYLIPEALREFRECFPQYSLSITPVDSPIVSEQILSGALDLGVLIRSEPPSKLRYHELFTDELGFIVSPLHPWARAGKVDRRRIAEERMILYSRNSATFQLLERYLVRMQAPLRDWIELGDMGAIKELVKLGLGVSATAEWTVRREIQDGSLALLPLPAGRVTRVWCIACAANREPSVAEQTFISLCQEVAGQLVGAAAGRDGGVRKKPTRGKREKL